jgi:release factor glutamine methyltransferase
MNFDESLEKSIKERLIRRHGQREGAGIFKILCEAMASIPERDQAARWEAWIEQIEAGEPVQYVVGFCWFYGLKISVNPSVLIPRPETEELVFYTLQWAQTKKLERAVVIDWCTGSGCIPLALKEAHPEWEVEGKDVAPGAVGKARENAERLGLDVSFAVMDITVPIIARTLADVITANPPYIEEGERVGMGEGVLRYEPELALFTPKNDATYFYRALMDRAAEELKPGGVVIMELSEYHGAEVQRYWEKHGWMTLMARDLSGKDRMLMASKEAGSLVSYRPF